VSYIFSYLIVQELTGDEFQRKQEPEGLSSAFYRLGASYKREIETVGAQTPIRSPSLPRRVNNLLLFCGWHVPKEEKLLWKYRLLDSVLFILVFNQQSVDTWNQPWISLICLGNDSRLYHRSLCSGRWTSLRYNLVHLSTRTSWDLCVVRACSIVARIQVQFLSHLGSY